MKKAALGAAALGIGGTVLANSVIPESQARSAGIQQCCSIAARGSVFVNTNDNNAGGCCFRGQASLSFGSKCLSCNCGDLFGCFSGEGIASQRTCGGPNKYGLDFYTGFKRRLSITQCGNAQFQNGVYVDATHNNNGSSLNPGLLFAGSGSGEGIASNRDCKTTCNVYGLDFYTGGSKRISVTNSGNVGIGTTAPCSTLCVAGKITGQKGVVGVFKKGDVAAAGVVGYSPCGLGVYGYNCGTVPGVKGDSPFGPGVQARSCFCFGLLACSRRPVVAKFKSAACAGDRSALVQFENADTTVVDWNVGVAGKCNGSKIPDGSFYIQQPTVSAIGLTINKCGYVGINNTNPSRRLCITGRIQASCGVGIGTQTQTINTTLAVNGSIAAKTRSVSGTITLTALDFAVFTNGTTTLTLPPANTQNGMILFIKKTDSATTLSIKPVSGDNIEGATSSTPKTLTKQYDSIQLISNGVHEWFVLSSAKCGVVLT